MGGEEVRSSPPPAPSPIKGEGSGAKVTHMTYLPLSASPSGGFAQKLKIEHRIDEFISVKIQ
jgi:hypothetical protein